MSTSSNNGSDPDALPPAGLEQETSKPADSSPKNSSEEEETSQPEPHALLHLIQCPRCSQPLRAPIHLPCGYTICRLCLPPLKRRADVSYPQGEGREEGFTCFWKGKGCGGGNDRQGFSSEHALADCGADVVLNKILGVFQKVLLDSSDANQRAAADIQIQWKTPSPTTGGIETENNGAVSSSLEVSKATINFGRYLGTYKLMQEGSLPYDAEDVVYENAMINGEEASRDSVTKLDEIVLNQLRRGIRDELDCQVCYSLIFKPWISLCGHTFCGECSNRVLDHSDLCPLCRRKMYTSLTAGARSTHAILNGILDCLFPSETKAREAAIQADYGTQSNQDGLLPLFACTLVFPSTSLHLHIFEPRYRLMVRRALESGTRRFGMVVDDFSGEPMDNGNIDREPPPSMQYGTLVSIDSWEFLPDGRIMLTVIGKSKFKVLRMGVLDGYHIASTERVHDISLAEEENIEAREVAAASAGTADHSQTEGEENEPRSPSTEPSLDSLSTQQLMEICMDFIDKRRREASPALYRRAIGMFGLPPTNPANFPYWFASVLPIADEEAYTLLPLTSVRERLKLAATWARMLEDRGWSVSTSSTCVIL